MPPVTPDLRRQVEDLKAIRRQGEQNALSQARIESNARLQNRVLGSIESKVDCLLQRGAAPLQGQGQQAAAPLQGRGAPRMDRPPTMGPAMKLLADTMGKAKWQFLDNIRIQQIVGENKDGKYLKNRQAVINAANKLKIGFH